MKCWSAVQLLSGVSVVYMSVSFKGEWEWIQFYSLSNAVIQSQELSHSATELVQAYG